MPEEQIPQLRLEELVDPESQTFTYIRRFTQDAIMDSSPEVRQRAIGNIIDIGKYLPEQPVIIGGYEKLRQLYLVIKKNGVLEEVYISDVASEYESNHSTPFTLNGARNNRVIINNNNNNNNG